MQVRLTPQARRDRREAEAWYRRRSPAAAARFRKELEAALLYISEYPYGTPLVDIQTRTKVVRDFPYSLLYVVLEDRLIVKSIAHHKREPSLS